MADIAIEYVIILFALGAALLLFREYQNRRKITTLKSESDDLRNSIYSLQTEEKIFRERDFRKLLADFNKMKDKLDEYEGENVRLKKLLEKKK
jgi:signal transduction histidine kinase